MCVSEIFYKTSTQKLKFSAHARICSRMFFFKRIIKVLMCVRKIFNKNLVQKLKIDAHTYIRNQQVIR